MLEQDWLYGLLGGVFIGLAASMFLLVNGRIMGASSIIGGIMHKSKENDYLELISFIIGLISLRRVETTIRSIRYGNNAVRKLALLRFDGIICATPLPLT